MVAAEERNLTNDMLPEMRLSKGQRCLHSGRKCVFLAVALLVFTSLLGLNYYINAPLWAPVYMPRPHVPVILAWTLKFQGDFADDLNKYHLANCTYECIAVNRDVRWNNSNGDPLESADAVIFHAKDLDGDYPVSRPNAPFVLMTHEAPPNIGMRLYQDSELHHYFNATISYLMSSTYYQPYDRMENITPTTTVGDIYTQDEVDEAIQKKSKQALIMYSNCNTHSRREVLIKELKETGLGVTEVGACGNEKCPAGDDCEEQLIVEHRFILAFENAVCNGYVSEKAFRLKKLIVPIVLSRKVVGSLLPRDSFIAVDDFSTAQQLVDYLQFLSENTTEYERYFHWTTKYKKTRASTHLTGMCKLCEDMHNHRNNYGFIDAPEWFDHSQCQEGFGTKVPPTSAQNVAISSYAKLLLVTLFVLSSITDLS